MLINASTDPYYFQVECDETGAHRYQVSVYLDGIKLDTFRGELDEYIAAYRVAAGCREYIGEKQNRVIPAGSIGVTDVAVQKYRAVDATLEDAISNPANFCMYVAPIFPPCGPAQPDA